MVRHEQELPVLRRRQGGCPEICAMGRDEGRPGGSARAPLVQNLELAVELLKGCVIDALTREPREDLSPQRLDRPMPANAAASSAPAYSGVAAAELPLLCVIAAPQ
eukprot:jgi/Ulvmu1/10662/UM066_0045.1